MAKKNIYDVVLLGGGASALMCAGYLDKSLDVAIVESNAKLAAKLKISGGGKCNITNTKVGVEHFDGEEPLIAYALETFSKENLLEYLHKNALQPVVRKNRYYFCKDSSDEIISILKKHASHVHYHLNTDILKVEKKEDIFEVHTSKGVLRSTKLVVATGGKSFKTLGASEIGLDIAKSFALKVKEFSPALVGMTLQAQEFWMKELSGLSCYVHIHVGGKRLEEEMLFAHKGISGPAVLSASLYWKKGLISINFLPSENIYTLIKGSKKLVSSVIPLPKRLARALLQAIGVEDVSCPKLTKEMKEKLQAIHTYSFAPAGNFGFTKAEVSRGGILAEELEYTSFEVKSVKNLYYIGEVVDVTGELGGYNFQWAFSSAVVCAKAIGKSV